jgi:signal recognition particle subunit SRP54
MPPSGDFTLDEFRKQLDELDKMGDMRSMIIGLPGDMEKENPKGQLLRIRRMIDAMSEQERRDPDCIDFSCGKRIAAESGTDPEEVEQFLEQFKELRELMRQMTQMNIWARLDG